MKKQYFMIAAAATLFAACAETDLIDEVSVQEVPQAIGFETFANKQTRAEITQTSHLQTATGGFHVWGYKNRGDEAEYTVFDNIPVSWVDPVVNNDGTTTNGYWTYDVPQYWDQTATYKFYAVAPKASQTVSYAIGDGTVNNWNKYMIKITGATSGKSTEVTDYLIDRDGKSSKINNQQVQITGSEGFDDGIVSFNFNHIMAKLSFMFKAGVNENITITSLKMTGWDAGAGTFTQNATNVPSSVANTEWTIATPVIANSDECVIIDSSNSLSGVNNTNAIPGGYSYIMVPQKIDGGDLTFTISYTITRTVNGNSVTETFKDQVGVLEADQVWGTDTHTTYTIVVSPDKIEFGDPTIITWSVTNEKAEETLPL